MPFVRFLLSQMRPAPLKTVQKQVLDQKGAAEYYALTFLQQIPRSVCELTDRAGVSVLYVGSFVAGKRVCSAMAQW